MGIPASSLGRIWSAFHGSSLSIHLLWTSLLLRRLRAVKRLLIHIDLVTDLVRVELEHFRPTIITS